MARSLFFPLFRGTAAVFFAAVLCAAFAGCAPKTVAPPSAAQAVDGPELAVVGEYEGMSLRGTMDRTCMVGVGRMTLHAADAPETFSCTAALNAPPSEKARVRGFLECTDNRKFLFSLRNIGPDQGVGIGREREDGELMILFYHSSAEEADRRFDSVRADIARARAGVRQ